MDNAERLNNFVKFCDGYVCENSISPWLEQEITWLVKYAVDRQQYASNLLYVLHHIHQLTFQFREDTNVKENND